MLHLRLKRQKPQQTSKPVVAVPYRLPEGAVVRVSRDKVVTAYVVTGAVYITAAGWQYTGFVVDVDGSSLKVRGLSETFWQSQISRVNPRFCALDWYMDCTIATPDGSAWFSEAV